MEAGHANRTFEIVDPIDTDTNRSFSDGLRCELDRGAEFQFVVHLVAHLRAIVSEGYVVPLVQRMEQFAVHQGLLASARSAKSIQTPLIANEACFEQQPIVRARFLQMEKPLLRRAAGRGTENYFPREGYSTGERVNIEKYRVLHAVEFHSLAGRSVNQFGLPHNRSGISADAIQMVEVPYFGRCWGRCGQTGHEEQGAAWD